MSYGQWLIAQSSRLKAKKIKNHGHNINPHLGGGMHYRRYGIKKFSREESSQNSRRES